MAHGGPCQWRDFGRGGGHSHALDRGQGGMGCGSRCIDVILGGSSAWSGHTQPVGVADGVLSGGCVRLMALNRPVIVDSERLPNETMPLCLQVSESKAGPLLNFEVSQLKLTNSNGGILSPRTVIAGPCHCAVT